MGITRFNRKWVFCFTHLLEVENVDFISVLTVINISAWRRKNSPIQLSETVKLQKQRVWIYVLTNTMIFSSNFSGTMNWDFFLLFPIKTWRIIDLMYTVREKKNIEKKYIERIIRSNFYCIVWNCTCSSENAEGEVWQKLGIFSNHNTSVTKNVSPDILTKLIIIFFFPKETFNQLISQFVSELLIDMAEDNSYSSYQKLSPLAGILPKTPTQRAVCRHDVFYSFSLPCLFYFQARLLESQHTFLNLINPSVLALPIKFLPF